MTDAETILKMIEEVDPADTAKLDEIDARVLFYLGSGSVKELIRIYKKRSGGIDEALSHSIFFKHAPEYTRSRDALKAIRPESWGIMIQKSHISPGFCCDMWSKCEYHIEGNGFETEELAELHAIIQAIAYERASVST